MATGLRMGKQIIICGGEMALTLAYQMGRRCPGGGAEGVFGTPCPELFQGYSPTSQKPKSSRAANRNSYTPGGEVWPWRPLLRPPNSSRPEGSQEDPAGWRRGRLTCSEPQEDTGVGTQHVQWQRDRSTTDWPVGAERPSGWLCLGMEGYGRCRW